MKDAADQPIIAVSQPGALPKTGIWRYREPYYEDRTPPCHEACPLGEDIVTQMRLVEQQRYKEALDLLMQTNPLPAVMGRICAHPCETPCNRKAMGGAVSIRQIERFLGGWALENDYRPRLVSPHHPPVAVIGSGPAGLSCAYYLRMLGHPVRVFEQDGEIGGFLRYAVPEFRLPKSVLKGELKRFSKLGIQFETGRRFGKDLSLQELNSAGFAAMVFAFGSGQAAALGIEGENLPGVADAGEWLAEMSAGKRPAARGAVAVIGEGETAVDCARCLIRLGAKPLVICRDSKSRMRAAPEDIQDAQAEGVEFKFLSTPVKIQSAALSAELRVPGSAGGAADGGLLLTLAAANARTGQGGASSGASGGEEVVAVRQVLKALGKTAQGRRPPQKFSAEQLRPPRVLRKAYFCGEGDGGGAAYAVGCGRRAAYAASSDLLGLTLPEPHPARDRGASPTTAKFKEFNTAYFENVLRVPEPIEASGEAVNDLREIRKSIGEPGALAEAQRCFKCGTCTLCGNCRIFCPDRAICYDDPSGKFNIRYDYCKGCGVCAEECPQAALHMRDADAGSTR